MVIDQRRQQVMCGTDGMEVTGEVQVDVFHRHDLGITATCGTTFHAETGTEARLTQSDNRFLTNPAQTVAQANRGGGFTFASRGW